MDCGFVFFNTADILLPNGDRCGPVQPLCEQLPLGGRVPAESCHGVEFIFLRKMWLTWSFNPRESLQESLTYVKSRISIRHHVIVSRSSNFASFSLEAGVVSTSSARLATASGHIQTQRQSMQNVRTYMYVHVLCTVYVLHALNMATRCPKPRWRRADFLMVWSTFWRLRTNLINLPKLSCGFKGMFLYFIGNQQYIKNKKASWQMCNIFKVKLMIISAEI